MKKSLIALAALAATSAFAQSSVTLYGIVEATVDVGYKRTIESTNTVRGFDAAGTATGTSPTFTAPVYVANVLTFGGAVTPAAPTVNSGNTTVRNEQKNGFRVQDGSSQGTGTSRVGFRGTEDLGGGMKANFQVEMGLRIDDGCTTAGGVVGAFGTASTAATGVACNNGGGSEDSGGSTFGRNAWGGISGSFGEVRLGRQVLGSFGVQGNSSSAGASSGLYDASAASLIPMGGVRFSNAIRYISPNISGFTGSVMFAAPESGATGNFTSTSSSAPNPALSGNLVTTGGASRRTGVDLALEYANGPAYVGFGYNKRDAGNNTSGASPFAVGGTSNFQGNNVSVGTITGYTLGGSYDLGVVKPFLNYTRQTTQTGRTDSLVTGSTVTDNSIAASGNLSQRAVSVGLRAPVGAFTIIAGYGRHNANGGGQQLVTQAAGSTVYRQATQVSQNLFQLGTQYALSKRTLLEANYGYNKTTTNTNSTVSGAAGVNGGASGAQTFRATDRISAFNVGLKHSF